MALTPEEQAMKEALMNRKPRGNEKAAKFLESNDPLNLGLQSILGAGDALNEYMVQGVNAAAKPINKAFGTDIGYEPLQSGKGAFYEGGKFAGEIAPYMVPGTIAGRMMTSAGLGAIGNPEDMLKGGAEGAAWGVLGEAIGPAAQGLKNAGKYGLEKIYPEAFKKETAQTIKEGFEKAYSKAWGKVSPFIGKEGKYADELMVKRGPYGEKRMPEGLHEFEEYIVKNIDDAGAGSKNLYELFEKNPTIDNAFELIKQLKSDARSVTKVDPNFSKKTKFMNEAANKLQKSFVKRVDDLEPGFKDIYSDYLEEYKKEVVPWRSQNTLKSSALGNVEELSAISNAITKSAKKQTRSGEEIIHPKHELIGINEKAMRKMAEKEAIPKIVRAPMEYLIPSNPKSRQLWDERLSTGGSWLNKLLRPSIQKNSGRPEAIEIETASEWKGR